MSNSFDSSADILFEESRPQKFPWVNVALFALTCLTTLLMGTALMAMYTNSFTAPGVFLSEILRAPSLLQIGIPFSYGIMTMLLVPEMVEYLACRYFEID